jgi:hypothetical protein
VERTFSVRGERGRAGHCFFQRAEALCGEGLVFDFHGFCTALDPLVEITMTGGETPERWRMLPTLLWWCCPRPNVPSSDETTYEWTAVQVMERIWSLCREGHHCIVDSALILPYNTLQTTTDFNQRWLLNANKKNQQMSHLSFSCLRMPVHRCARVKRVWGGGRQISQCTKHCGCYKINK